MQMSNILLPVGVRKDAADRAPHYHGSYQESHLTVEPGEELIEFEEDVPPRVRGESRHHRKGELQVGDETRAVESLD